MLTEEQNDRLARVGPGTAMGSLLRRYWMPVGASPDLQKDPVKKTRVLGEDLVLYKTEKGEYGLMQERCPHRSCSMSYGIPTDQGVRCAYHGWLDSPSGKCLEQPFEDTVNPAGTFRERIRFDSYPVEELGGLFAYLGPPHKKPLLNDAIDKVSRGEDTPRDLA